MAFFSPFYESLEGIAEAVLGENAVANISRAFNGPGGDSYTSHVSGRPAANTPPSLPVPVPVPVPVSVPVPVPVSEEPPTLEMQTGNNTSTGRDHTLRDSNYPGALAPLPYRPPVMLAVHSGTGVAYTSTNRYDTYSLYTMAPDVTPLQSDMVALFGAASRWGFGPGLLIRYPNAYAINTDVQLTPAIPPGFDYVYCTFEVHGRYTLLLYGPDSVLSVHNSMHGQYTAYASLDDVPGRDQEEQLILRVAGSSSSSCKVAAVNPDAYTNLTLGVYDAQLQAVVAAAFGNHGGDGAPFELYFAPNGQVVQAYAPPPNSVLVNVCDIVFVGNTQVEVRVYKSLLSGNPIFEALLHEVQLQAVNKTVTRGVVDDTYIAAAVNGVGAAAGAVSGAAAGVVSATLAPLWYGVLVGVAIIVVVKLW